MRKEYLQDPIDEKEKIPEPCDDNEATDDETTKTEAGETSIAEIQMTQCDEIEPVVEPIETDSPKDNTDDMDSTPVVPGIMYPDK